MREAPVPNDSPAREAQSLGRPSTSAGPVAHAAAPCRWLRDADLLVRPPAEPLPAPLREHGGSLAQAFRHWLRQRDDPAHAADKALLTETLQAVSPADVDRAARRQAVVALGGGWGHWCWTVPSATVAALLGLPMDSVADQQRLHGQLRAIAAGLSPQAAAGAVARGSAAVDDLLAALAEAHGPASPEVAGWSSASAHAANRLALLWQSHEAGAALLGHALLAGEATDESLLRLARSGGAVRLTRRFARCPMTGPHGPLVAGEMLTVPLLDHPFGDGPHQCPGTAIALQTIRSALAAVREMPGLRRPVALAPLVLPNARIPQFAAAPLPLDLEVPS